MAHDAAVFARYSKIIVAKLAAYLSPEAIERFQAYSIEEKIRFLSDIKIVLEKSVIIGANPPPELSNLKKLVQGVYNFLYKNNNHLSAQSYIETLMGVYTVEKEGTSTQKYLNKKDELQKLDQLFIDFYSHELGLFLPQISDMQIKRQVQEYRRSVRGSIILAVLYTLIVLFMIGCNNPPREETNTKANATIEKTEQTNNSENNRKEFFKHLNSENALINASNYLMLADTCSTWTLIKSLDSLKSHVQVNVYHNAQLTMRASIGDSTATKERFAKLCQLAVEYTLAEYPKHAPFPITKIPSTIGISIFYDESSTSGASSQSSTDSIQINIGNRVFKDFAIGPSAFLLFSAIAHETVHLLVGKNDPDVSKYKMLERQLVEEHTQKKILLERIDTRKVDMLIKLFEDNNKHTEVEAYKFDDFILNSLLRPILNNDQSHTVLQSYCTSILGNIKSSEIQQIIIDALNTLRNSLHPLEKRLAEADSPSYNDRNQQIQELRMFFNQ